MAVGKNGTVKGHLPRKVSHVCTLSRKKGDHNHCRVTGRQRYSVDLRLGSIIVKLRYSTCSITSRGSNFSMHVLLIFVTEYNYEN